MGRENHRGSTSSTVKDLVPRAKAVLFNAPMSMEYDAVGDQLKAAEPLATAREIDDIYGRAQITWTDLEDAYTLNVRELHECVRKAAKHGISERADARQKRIRTWHAALSNLLAFEIVRDSFQILGLYLTDALKDSKPVRWMATAGQFFLLDIFRSYRTF